MPILSIDEVIERIDAVTIDDLRALAGELFAPARCRSPASGPTSERFDDAIEPLRAGADRRARRRARRTATPVPR